MTTVDASSVSLAYLRRWLIAMLMVFVVATYDLGSFVVILPRPEKWLSLEYAVYGGLMMPAFVYAATFFTNLFFVQGYDRMAREHRAWRLLAGGVTFAAVLAAIGWLAVWLTRIVFVIIFELGTVTTGYIILLAIAASLVGAIFGGAVGLLHHLGGTETGWSRGLMTGHIVGGVIAGVVLSLTYSLPVLATASREIRLMMLYVAYLPHMILTWCAVQPTIAERAHDLPTVALSSIRLAGVIAALAIAKAALFLSAHVHT